VIDRLSTIRAITTCVATIIVALALTVGAIGLIAAARSTMVNEVTESAQKQAAEIVGQLESRRPPILEVAGSDEQLVQVLTAAGAVVASSQVAGSSRW
jgi:predicted dinucleotide-utilizing enzyme